MNFLGHLYFSDNDLDLMVANLYGDFVKGKDYSHLPVVIQKGVLLHRQIDDFIDHHPAIKTLRSNLFLKLPKIAGIAIDLYVDHILAKNWSTYSKTKLEDFVETFFQHALNPNNQYFGTKNTQFKYPDEFIHLLSIMHQKKWIVRYQELEGLKMASMGLSKRISFENNLDQATEVFIQHQDEIHSVFQVFMKDAQQKFKHNR